MTILAEESGPGWRMLLGDCLKIMPLVGAVDHVMVDPPYEEQAHTKARRALKDATQKRGAANTGEVRRIDQPLEIDFPAITEDDRRHAAVLYSELARRWVIAFSQIEAVASWRASFVEGGLEWVRGGIWRKPDGAPQFTGDRPGMGFECLAIAHHRGRKRWNGGGRHAFWECSLEHGHGNGTRNEHPTQKPLRLMLDLVRDFTDPGESILDSHAGSGTTLVAAVRLGRHAIGIERNETYFKYAVERLRAESGTTTVAASRAGQAGLFGSGS